ncbi:MAG: RluA family pseudouridine synthase [Oscillospiraceae bacterium]|nr:RluA family pseudouridine synthase [Oscillospiraceae bacterium]
MDILYQDNRVIVCIKPHGILSTDEPGGLPGLLREQLGDEKACVRTVHRLDRVVGGVMVLARSREAAKRLSGQVQDRSFRKTYLAVVWGELEQEEGTLRDLLLRSKEEKKTYLVTETGKDVQEAVLNYRVLGRKEGRSLVEIHLVTGRTHQIRAQFSGHGHPLVGDKKYGAPEEQMEGIALWSCHVGFQHPQTGEEMDVRALPPRTEPWTAFQERLGKL